MAKAADHYKTNEAPTLEAHPDRKVFRLIIWERDQDTGSRSIRDILEFDHSHVRKQVKPKSRRDITLFKAATFTADEARAALAEYDRRSNERD